MKIKNQYFDYVDLILLIITIFLFGLMVFLIRDSLKKRGTLTTVQATIVDKIYIPKKVIQYEKFYLYRGWKIEEDVYPQEYWFEYKYENQYGKKQVSEQDYNFYNIGDTRWIDMYIKKEKQ